MTRRTFAVLTPERIAELELLTQKVPAEHQTDGTSCRDGDCPRCMWLLKVEGYIPDLIAAAQRAVDSDAAFEAGRESADASLRDALAIANTMAETAAAKLVNAEADAARKIVERALQHTTDHEKLGCGTPHMVYREHCSDCESFTEVMGLRLDLTRAQARFETAEAQLATANARAEAAEQAPHGGGK